MNRCVSPSTNANRLCCASRARSKPYNLPRNRISVLNCVFLYPLYPFYVSLQEDRKTATHPSLPSLRPPKLPVPHPAHEHHRALPLLPCSRKLITQPAYAISTVLSSMRARKRAAQKPYNEPVGTRTQHACEQDQRVFCREPRVGL